MTDEPGVETPDPRRSRRRIVPAQPEVADPEPGPTGGRRRPPPGRISPEALAASRGGAVEGLAWLGRPPEAKASILYRVAAAGRPVRHLRRVPVPDPDLGPGAPAARRLPARRGRAPRLDGSVRRHARDPDRAARLVPRQRAVDVHHALARAAHPSARWPAAGLARRRRDRPARRVGAGGHRQRRRLRPDARGDRERAGRAGSGRSGPAGRSSPCGPTRRSCRSPSPGRRSSTSAGGWRRGSCRSPRSVPWPACAPDAPFPAEGTREELALAHRMSDALAGDPRTGRRGALPVDRRSARASAPAARAADLAAAATRPARPRRLTRPPGAAHGILARMHYAESILDLVGGTPLVRISRLTRDLGPADRQPLLLAKLEMLNPGGSVKDRIGLPMIEAAERAGLLQPGGTIIEPTSGNTGHGLAIAAALKGYRCIFVMADKQSSEKQQLLRAYGAEVVLCPTNVAPESPESYYSVAARLARDIPGAFKPDQYWNEENPTAHERTTGPELWDADRGPDHPFRRERRDRRHDHRRRPGPQGPQPGDPGDRRRPRGQRPVRRRRPPVPDRGRRGGLPPGHLRPDRRRPLGPRQRPRRVRDGAPADPRGGDPVGRLVRDRDGRRARGRPRPDRDRRRRGGGRRRAPARQRPELPVEDLQRRVDARERPARHDRGRRPGRGPARRPPPRRPAARTSCWPGRPSASARRSRSSRSTGSASSRSPSSPTATRSRASSARSPRRACSIVPSATRRSSSGPSAR